MAKYHRPSLLTCRLHIKRETSANAHNNGSFLLQFAIEVASMQYPSLRLYPTYLPVNPTNKLFTKTSPVFKAVCIQKPATFTVQSLVSRCYTNSRTPIRRVDRDVSRLEVLVVCILSRNNPYPQASAPQQII